MMLDLTRAVFVIGILVQAFIAVLVFLAVLRIERVQKLHYELLTSYLDRSEHIAHAFQQSVRQPSANDTGE